MINLTSQYPNTTFLPVGTTQLTAQINSINSSGIINKDFPKKLLRANVGTAPDGSGAKTSQIDVLINGNSTYAFQNLASAQEYAQEAGAQMVNNANYYVENVQPGFYQIVVWGAV